MTLACFVVDGGSRIGMGHLSRSLVLAEALARHGVKSRFFVPDPVMLPRVEQVGFAGALWPDALASLPAADLLVADGRPFDASWLAEWKGRFRVRMVVDDMAESPLECDLLLNHNLYGARLDYGAYACRELLVGPEFALVAGAFAACRTVPREVPPRVVISFGGSDDGSLAWGVTEEVLRLAGEGITLDLAFPSTTALIDSPRRSQAVRIHRGADMPRLMAGASLYVGGAGVTMLEAMAAGLEMVLVQLAEDQRHSAAEGQRLGFAVLKRFDARAVAEAVLPTLQHKVREVAAVVVDGLGAGRVARRLLTLLEQG